MASIRTLTKEQITKLSDETLKRYERTAKEQRRIVEPNPDYAEKASEEDIKKIKRLDWIIAECWRQVAARKYGSCSDCGQREKVKEKYGMSAKCRQCWRKRIGNTEANVLFKS